MKNLACALTCLLVWDIASAVSDVGTGPDPLLASPVEWAGWSSPDTIPQAIVEGVCSRCHGERRQEAGLSFEGFEVASAERDPETAERMIRRLRAGMMPPPGIRRPPEHDLVLLAETLEQKVDDAAAAHGSSPAIPRTFQRLTRSEYERAVWDLLGLQVDASAFLPAETISAGFDNIADVQQLSATLLEGYLSAAAEVSRYAVGDPLATPSEAEYEVSRYAEQRGHVEGAPVGTRGGISLIHNFVVDGDYVFRLAFQHESTGNFFGQTTPFDEQIELSVDGERRALIDIDRWMHRQDPNGVQVETPPIAVTAGPRRITAAFIKRFDGPVEDLVSPHEWSLADKKIGYSHGITVVAHLRDLTVRGPFNPRGVSDYPARDRVLSCRPETPREARPCARSILSELATNAYGRPVTDADVAPLLRLYDEGEAAGGFAEGIRLGLQGILAGPDFVFRFEEPIGADRDRTTYRLSPLKLASRLSFFLWGGPPDEALVEAALTGQLADEDGLKEQVSRMLAHPRAEALANRFAAQWLRLQDLDGVHPDALRFPDYYEQLAGDMRRETEMLFAHLVREDRPFSELLTADYTFVNDRLARHYDIPGVAGPHFRRVMYPDESRRGVLSHGSILVSTSHANRTSPVLRGKWVLEVLLGIEPPPPPPDVPDLEATEEAEEGRFFTVRERMEMHRANPACRSCHRVIDPLGLALENFDVTGAWRIKDQGRTVDTSGDLFDGTPLAGPEDLRAALLKRPEALARAFTESLMAYALGRRVDYRDMPRVREITSDAKTAGYRLSAFVMGVATSEQFISNSGLKTSWQ